MFAIVCDPIFFALSGYFAIRPLKGTLNSYYLRKISAIVLPLFIYSLVLYLYTTNFMHATIPGYFEYFLNVLTPWWFIPSLIPYLIIAPFLYLLFEALNDRQFKFLLKLVLILMTWGITLSFLTWIFQSTGHATLGRIVGIAGKILPASLLPNSYFTYFCLGYFLRRLIPQLSSRRKMQLIVIGAVAWIVDVLFAYKGIGRVDPSYLWIFVTIGMFIAFDQIAIKSAVAQDILSWTAKRSYSIYLLQYTTIAICTPFVYDTLFQSAVHSFFAPARIAIWFLSMACSYFLALAIASLIDTTLLKMTQNCFERVAQRFAVTKS